MSAAAPTRISLFSLFSLMALLGSALALAGAASAVQTEAVHELSFKIHVDLIAGDNDLPFWQARLDDALETATRVLQGDQGPVDTACCTRIARNATLTTFGSPADGLDVIESQDDLDALRAFGDGAYLVFDVQYCNGPSTDGVGCADLGQGGTPAGFLVVEVALDSGSIGHFDGLGTTIAHERGHNVGLGHLGDELCQLMSGFNSGGCLSISECAEFVDQADSTGDSCECHGEVVLDPVLAEGSFCTGAPVCGTCSGGLCGACDSEAGVSLLLAAGTEDPISGVPDDAARQSTLAGGFGATISIGAEVRGLAYSSLQQIVYAVGPTPGGGPDRLMRLDPATGALLSTVGTLGAEGYQALAYDPSQNILYATFVDAEIFSDAYDCVGITGCDPGVGCISHLVEIDPQDAATTQRGALNEAIICEGTDGLAFDGASGTLYGASAAGLFEIELGTCTGTACQTPLLDNRFVSPGALAFDGSSGTLLRTGALFNHFPTMMSIDPAALAASDQLITLLGIADAAPGGLTVVPIPEPSATAGIAVALVTLTSLRAHRARRST